MHRSFGGVSFLLLLVTSTIIFSTILSLCRFGDRGYSIFTPPRDEIYRGGSLEIISEGVAVSAPSDLWKISEGYEKKIPLF